MPCSQAFDLRFLVLHTALFENETEKSEFIFNLFNNELKTMIRRNALPKKNLLLLNARHIRQEYVCFKNRLFKPQVFPNLSLKLWSIMFLPFTRVSKKKKKKKKNSMRV